VIDAHKGKIKVESTPGKGSIFTLEVPLLQENNQS
jgi:signal transduction histidine kinase